MRTRKIPNTDTFDAVKYFDPPQIANKLMINKMVSEISSVK